MYLLTRPISRTGQFELPYKSMAVLGNTSLKTMKSEKPNLLFLYPLKRLETLRVFPDVYSGYGYRTIRGNRVMSPNFASDIKQIQPDKLTSTSPEINR